MMWVMLVSVVINEAGAEWGLSTIELSLYAMSQSVGVFLGSYFWGYMSDKYGRMFSFKKTLILCGVAGCIASFSYDFPMLCVLAFIVGIGIGGDISVDGTVFIEFCPKADRHMLTLMSFVCVLGSILVPALAFVYTVVTNSDNWTWRYTMVTVSALNLVFGVLRLKCMETPHFYVTHGKVECANEVLRKLSAINKKPLALIPTEEDSATLMHDYQSDAASIGVSRQLQRLFKSKVRNTTLWFMLVVLI
jgi:MFS family permease